MEAVAVHFYSPTRGRGGHSLDANPDEATVEISLPAEPSSPSARRVVVGLTTCVASEGARRVAFLERMKNVDAIVLVLDSRPEADVANREAIEMLDAAGVTAAAPRVTQANANANANATPAACVEAFEAALRGLLLLDQ